MWGLPPATTTEGKGYTHLDHDPIEGPIIDDSGVITVEVLHYR